MIYGYKHLNIFKFNNNIMELKQKVKELLEEGKSYEEIAEVYDKLTYVPRKEIKQLLEKGKSYEEIAEKHSVPIQTVELIDGGIPKELEEDIKQYHKKGLTDKDIAKLLDKTPAHITNVRRALGLKNNHSIYLPDLVKYLEEGKSYEEIAEMLDISINTVIHYASFFRISKKRYAQRKPIQPKCLVKRVEGWRCVKTLKQKQFKFHFYRKYMYISDRSESSYYKWMLNILLYQNNVLIGDVWLKLPNTIISKEPNLLIYKDFIDVLPYNNNVDLLIKTLKNVVSDHLRKNKEIELKYYNFSEHQSDKS